MELWISMNLSRCYSSTAEMREKRCLPPINITPVFVKQFLSVSSIKMMIYVDVHLISSAR